MAAHRPEGNVVYLGIISKSILILAVFFYLFVFDSFLEVVIDLNIAKTKSRLYMGSNHVTSVFMAAILKTSDQDKNTKPHC